VERREIHCAKTFTVSILVSASLALATSPFPIFPSQPLLKKILQADGLDAVRPAVARERAGSGYWPTATASPLVRPDARSPPSPSGHTGEQIAACPARPRSSTEVSLAEFADNGGRGLPRPRYSSLPPRQPRSPHAGGRRVGIARDGDAPASSPGEAGTPGGGARTPRHLTSCSCSDGPASPGRSCSPLRRHR
jgi:hypothetical protein